MNKKEELKQQEIKKREELEAAKRKADDEALLIGIIATNLVISG